MHEQWQDMIPFYIAGSLTGAEASALERHLAGCELCRREAEAWGLIADAVRAEAKSWSQPPPLALEIRAQLYGSVNGARRETLPPAHPYQRPVPRRRWRFAVPATLTAVVAVLLLFGGLLVFMALRGALEEKPQYASGSPVVPTLTASPMPSPTYTPGPDEVDMGILPPPDTPTPLPQPSSTLPPPSTSTPLPTATSQDMNPLVCYAVNTSGDIVPLYRRPGETSERTGMLVRGESRRTWVYNEDDWYQIGEPSGGIAGWVRGDLVTLQGNCGGMALPSPTYTPQPSPAATEPTATPPGPCQPDFYRADADRNNCPSQTQTPVQAAYQPFEGGLMLWRNDTGGIWVLTHTGTVLHYEEATYGTRPANPVTETPPEGLHKPVSGFGRVWGNFERVRNALGWATVPERGYTMTVQAGQPSGFMAYFYMTLPDGRVVQIHDNMTWNFAE